MIIVSHSNKFVCKEILVEYTGFVETHVTKYNILHTEHNIPLKPHLFSGELMILLMIQSWMIISLRYLSYGAFRD